MHTLHTMDYGDTALYAYCRTHLDKLGIAEEGVEQG